MKSTKTDKQTLVSIIIPVLNEEGNVEILYQSLLDALKKSLHQFEVLFIDDGSTDKTLSIIDKIAQKDPRIRGISFSRNFGHQAALSAGLDLARGDAVISMDGDLQHPPKLIPTLLDKWKEGFDVVYTIREETADASSFKLATAKWFYRLMNKIGHINLPANAADFRLLSRPVVDELKRLEERALFLRGLVQWVGFRQTAVSYKAEKRYSGKSKFALGSMLKFAADGITSFSTAPLLFSLYFGFCVSILSFLYALYAIYARLFTNQSLPGWASILVAVLFLGGVQLITLGILGLYLGKLFQEVKRRPRYIVKDTIGDIRR
jgi:glycosyltransferase involved in cell wall biosynthesis